MQAFTVFSCIRFPEGLTREGLSSSPGELQVTTSRADAEVSLQFRHTNLCCKTGCLLIYGPRHIFLSATY